MLILSLLVGSLLVGRQIVDRAKIQRIIFEFDYYEKAFHQFYDTYRIIPGHMTQKVCKRYAVFSAKIASDIDAKIDDGRPGTGKVVASKGNHFVNVNSDAEKKAICYDKTFDEVDKAIYNESKDVKYGCNLLKVMEDVK